MTTRPMLNKRSLPKKIMGDCLMAFGAFGASYLAAGRNGLAVAGTVIGLIALAVLLAAAGASLLVAFTARNR